MELLELKQNALREIANSKDVKVLEGVRVKYLGRESGELTAILKSLKIMSVEERKKVGPLANEIRSELENAFTQKLLKFEEQLIMGSKIDITIPGIKVEMGHLHPLTIIEDRIKEIFAELNFSIVEGPEVETEHYNFDALNIPAGHPARDMWDTFWLCQNEIKNQKSNIKIEENLLLRTHTSPMQIRYMETHEPPFQIIVPGRVFRFEAIDAAHQINFHQVEGLMVGQDVSLANFKYIISEFFKKLFNGTVEMRFRPSYFPFVEPGLEVDIKLSGKWLEVMGAGMVHHNVFDAVKYNPKFVRGFAFGLGLERLAMIKYNITDIRLFYENDLRFLKQF
jgi:phenylalanyl-tRNA synthetase alpha chain